MEILEVVNQRSEEVNTMLWSLYPNPTSDQLTITFDTLIDSGEVMITDQLGRCIEDRIIAKQSEFILNVHNYEPGVFYIRVSTGDRLVYIDKFIVK